MVAKACADDNMADTSRSGKREEQTMGWRVLDRTLNLVVCVIYAVLTLIAFAQVVVRYLLGGSIPWSEEAARFLFIWLAFLGFSVTMNRGGHVGVDVLVAMLPGKARKAAALFCDSLIVGFLIFFIVKGMDVVQVTLYNRSPAMQISMGYVYIILPLSAALLILYTLRVARRHWAGDFGPWK
jgi:TRAP-type transport system small permease protein